MKFSVAAALTAFVAISSVSAYSHSDYESRDVDQLVERDANFEYGLEARYSSDLDERDFDADLEVRYPSEELVERFASNDALQPRVAQIVVMIAKQVVEEVLKVAIKAIGDLIGDIRDENKNRETFVKNVLAGLVAKDPSFNYMLVHPKHTTKWDGTENVDWYHRHQECDTIRLFKKTIGYEIYAARSGTFELQGDGGFINWAFQGNFKREGNQGHIVKFARIGK